MDKRSEDAKIVRTVPSHFAWESGRFAELRESSADYVRLTQNAWEVSD